MQISLLISFGFIHILHSREAFGKMATSCYQCDSIADAENCEGPNFNATNKINCTDIIYEDPRTSGEFDLKKVRSVFGHKSVRNDSSTKCITVSKRNEADNKDYYVRTCVTMLKDDLDHCAHLKEQLGEKYACATCETDFCNGLAVMGKLNLMFVVITEIALYLI